MLAFPLALIAAYLSGALPWSVWLGRLLYGIDPRRQSDGNPGAANAFRAGGWRLGGIVLLLDFLKGFAPVFVAKWGLQLPASELFWVALMPTLGHAFSVFLRLRGGRALDTLFGVWTGLTLYEMPLVMGGTAILGMVILKDDAQRALAIPVVLLLALLVSGKPVWMAVLAFAQLIILASKLAAHYRSAHGHDASGHRHSALGT